MNFTKVCSKIHYLKAVDKIKGWAAVAALIFLITGCDKPKTFVLKTTSPASHFDMKDTMIPVYLQTEYLDSLQSNNLSQSLVGSLQDAELGGSDANLYFQYRLLNLAPNFGTNPQADSIVMYLAYAGTPAYDGDLGAKQTWNIYPLLDGLDNNLIYYTNNYIRPDFSTRIGSYNGKFNVSDTVLRVKLDNSYAAKLLASNANVFVDNTSFQTVFKGIGILPDHSSIAGSLGAIIHVNLQSARTKIILFYHNSTSKIDSLQFIVTSADEQVNTYGHSYSRNVTSRIDKPNSDKAYVQSMAGLKAKITFPDGLRSFMTNGTTAISEAQLVFPEASTGNSPFTEPAQLYVYPRSSTGGNETTNSDFGQTFIDETYGDYGGLWNPTSKRYSFIITAHLQSLLDRYKRQANYNTPGGLQYQGMNLFIPSDNPVLSSRVILRTYNPSAPLSSGPYLKLIYTKVAEQ